MGFNTPGAASSAADFGVQDNDSGGQDGDFGGQEGDFGGQNGATLFFLLIIGIEKDRTADRTSPIAKARF